jgi:hypothetical protein
MFNKASYPEDMEGGWDAISMHLQYLYYISLGGQLHVTAAVLQTLECIVWDLAAPRCTARLPKLYSLKETAIFKVKVGQIQVSAFLFNNREIRNFLIDCTVSILLYWLP